MVWAQFGHQSVSNPPIMSWKCRQSDSNRFAIPSTVVTLRSNARKGCVEVEVEKYAASRNEFLIPCACHWISSIFSLLIDFTAGTQGLTPTPLTFRKTRVRNRPLTFRRTRYQKALAPEARYPPFRTFVPNMETGEANAVNGI